MGLAPTPFNSWFFLFLFSFSSLFVWSHDKSVDLKRLLFVACLRGAALANILAFALATPVELHHSSSHLPCGIWLHPMLIYPSWFQLVQLLLLKQVAHLLMNVGVFLALELTEPSGIMCAGKMLHAFDVPWTVFFERNLRSFPHD